jgi:hypothetical protein|tara:strand:- start:1632 stop:1898 length:267 start_codon:yes stop_codon:yes gene_type:complete
LSEYKIRGAYVPTLDVFAPVKLRHRGIVRGTAHMFLGMREDLTRQKVQRRELESRAGASRFELVGERRSAVFFVAERSRREKPARYHL